MNNHEQTFKGLNTAFISLSHANPCMDIKRIHRIYAMSHIYFIFDCNLLYDRKEFMVRWFDSFVKSYGIMFKRDKKEWFSQRLQKIEVTGQNG